MRAGKAKIRITVMMKRDFYKQSPHAIKAAKAIIETRSEL